EPTTAAAMAGVHGFTAARILSRSPTGLTALVRLRGGHVPLQDVHGFLVLDLSERLPDRPLGGFQPRVEPFRLSLQVVPLNDVRGLASCGPPGLVRVIRAGVAGPARRVELGLEPVHLVEEERAVVLGLVEGADGVLGALQGLLIASPDSGETVGGKRLRHRRPHPGRSALPRGTAPAGGRGARGRARPTPGASPTRRTTGAPSVPPPRRAAAPPQRSGVAPSRATRPETRLPGNRASLQATATY